MALFPVFPTQVQADDIPARPGIYVFFLRQGEALDGTVVAGLEDGAPVYVGKAASGLRRRVLGHHLRSGRTGWSAFRRTLGAVLHERLQLKAEPRSDRRSGFFQFSPTGEAALTSWMLSHLAIAWYETTRGDARAEEVRALRRLRPALNDGMGHPWSGALGALRDRCRREAGVR